jgi:hypothetical protein
MRLSSCLQASEEHEEKRQRSDGEPEEESSQVVAGTRISQLSSGWHAPLTEFCVLGSTIPANSQPARRDNGSGISAVGISCVQDNCECFLGLFLFVFFFLTQRVPHRWNRTCRSIYRAKVRRFRDFAAERVLDVICACASELFCFFDSGVSGGPPEDPFQAVRKTHI